MKTNDILKRGSITTFCIGLILLGACAPKAEEGHPVTTEGAQTFMDEVEKHLLDLTIADSEAS